MKFLSAYNKRNFENKLLLAGAGFTFLIIFSITIYRFARGEYLIGFIDSILSLILVAVLLEYWLLKKMKYFNVTVVLCYSLAVLGAIYLKQLEALFWAFPVVVATYFFVSSGWAVLINSLFITAVIVIASFFKDLPHVGIFPSLVMVGIFGCLFSRRSERQTEDLKLLVSEDVLTKIKNRRSYNEKVEEILADNKRIEKSVCLLLLDLDFFKKINDSHGHKQGDQVLYGFAQTVKSLIRETDYIYRFGGEEFIVIANNSKLECAGDFADNIRKSVKNTPKLAKYDVTVSIGVTEINLTDDADTCFRRADLALYESKAQGRDRVYLAEQDDNGEINIRKVKSKPNLKLHPLPVKDKKKDKGLTGSHSFSQEQLASIDLHNKSDR